ncbi:hypothetical protein ACPCHT_14285 [Nucisporomicrobium flavum]|uniref:hypothetical protein n=1 Tax=Nucisporomicrobium flavum TaxID=2785915 RepID=UPI0018F2A48A|nr:hypothetical protein [Nucisporomicrobium flavum]
MSSGVDFPTEAVLHHAAAVKSARDDMAQVRAAAGEVVMDSQAYGQLCQFLPAILSPLFGSATEVMNDAVDALGETALNLRRTASEMSDTDTAGARRLTAASGPGDDLPL